MLDQCLSVDVHRAGGDLVVGLQKFIGLIARTRTERGLRGCYVDSIRQSFIVLVT